MGEYYLFTNVHLYHKRGTHTWYAWSSAARCWVRSQFTPERIEDYIKRDLLRKTSSLELAYLRIRYKRFRTKDEE